MKLNRIFPYLLILLIAAGCVSCDSTRRASRRIGRIVEQHPELMTYDTIPVDTLLPVTPPSDSTTVTETELDSGTMVVHRTGHGTFHIQKLPNRDVKITYIPDTVKLRYRDDFVVPKVIFEQRKRFDLADITKTVVILVIALLFLRLLLKKD